MAAEQNHNKFLNEAARLVLQEEGLFQKGQARTWIDDNGWFLTLVEFQPNWNKGSYVNVGIHYLWSHGECLDFDYGCRGKFFIAFRANSKTFFMDMVALAEAALRKAEECRQFRNLSFARERIEKVHGQASKAKEFYDKMMICGLAEEGHPIDYYEGLWETTKNSDLEDEKEYFRELQEEVSKVITNKKLFKEYVEHKIQIQREYWHSQTIMEKLPVEYRGFW